MNVTVNGLNIHYIDKGVGDTTVLLLHGWGVDASLYHLLIDHLAAYCRVVAPDLPGFGGSDEPSSPFTPDDYADFALAFAEALGITEAVTIGHSNGGRVLIKLLSRPSLSLTVRKAVLIDSAGLPAHHTFSYYVKVYSFKFIKFLFSLPPLKQLFPNAVDKARSKHGSADYQQASPVMRQSMVIALHEDVTPLLSSIKASTLLIWGKDDTATPLSDGQTMERLIPDAGLAVLEGGHWAFAERFEQCGRILDVFIKE
ncbi:MAG: alpha/beta hydrolase [Clostridia bacterium]|nr:alpha/beta hydrolase [Clostridia bacterium]